MFSYGFMVRAFIVGILLAIIVPSVGMTVVLKRLSMIGDALSHTALAGVAIGLVAGFNPITGAIIASVIGAIAIEIVREKFPGYQELSIAVIMSAGLGITGILSGYGNGSANISSYMFGSIVAISDLELRLIIIISAVVLLAVLLCYKEFFYLALSPRQARLVGIKTKYYSFLFTIITALTVAIASKTVGALVVSSLMVLPVACAMQTAKSYKTTLIASVIYGISFTAVGLTLSFYLGFRPGGAIVLTGVLVLVIIFVAKSVFKGRSPA